MQRIFVVLLIGTAAWMAITTLSPDIVAGAQSMITPHRAIRLLAIGIVAGLIGSIYLRRRRGS